MNASDLDAYFERIGYAGPRTASRATLDAIAMAHVCRIPFENLDVLLGRPIALSQEALMQKLVHDHRGGYCFEQNGLLLMVLQALGFAVTPLSARVRYQKPRDFTPPRTHVFLRVDLDGQPWAADVGVGGLSLTSAIRLDTDAEQATPHEPRRIIREAGRLFRQVKFGGAWHDVCEFTGEDMPPIDRELGNWFTSAHPQSHFKNRLTVARAAPDGVRLSVLNRDFTVRAKDGTSESRTLATPEELLQVLAEHFGLRFPAGTAFPCPALEWASRAG